METTYEELLHQLIEARDGNYRSDPERYEARVDTMEQIIQTMLEKLCKRPTAEDRSDWLIPAQKV